MITMSGAASVRPGGAERSAARDRRLSVRTRWTMTKVRLFPQPCLVVLFTAINKWAEKCPKFNI